MGAYFLNVHPHLLDVMLPLAAAYTGVAVVALVPVDYMTPAGVQRAAWFCDEVWPRGRGLFVRVVQDNGCLHTHGWLVLFAVAAARVRLL
jgi:hypothetical protein